MSYLCMMCMKVAQMWCWSWNCKSYHNLWVLPSFQRSWGSLLMDTNLQKKNLDFSDKLSTVFLQHTIHIILGPTHIWFLQCTMLNVDVVKWAVCLSCISWKPLARILCARKICLWMSQWNLCWKKASKGQRKSNSNSPTKVKVEQLLAAKQNLSFYLFLSLTMRVLIMGEWCCIAVVLLKNIRELLLCIRGTHLQTVPKCY